MRRMFVHGLAVVGLLACAGADESTGPASIDRDMEAHFQTDSLRYTLRAGSPGYEGQLIVTWPQSSK